MPEQRSFRCRTECRAASELLDAADVVEECRSEEEIRSQSRMELRRLAAQRRDAHRVLEQPACVAVVAVRTRSGKRPHPLAHLGVAEDAADEGRQARVRDLGGEELEEPLELVGVATQLRRETGRVQIGRLDGAHLELEPAVEALDMGEHSNRVALVEPAIEQLDVVPDASLDPAARIDELEHEVRLSLARRKASLARDREHAVDGAVFDELGDRSPRAESRGRAGRLGRWPTSARSVPSGTPGRAQR